MTDKQRISDKCFLKRIKENKVTWNYDAVIRSQELKEKGLIVFKYCPLAHAGWWVVTEKGNKILNTKER